MAIVINGSGTLTGVSVGGLPDGIVDTDMIATSAVTGAKIGSLPAGSILQVVQTVKTDGVTYGTSGTFAAISGFTVSITPSATSSKILILVQATVGTSNQYGRVHMRLTGTTSTSVGDAGTGYEATATVSPRSADGGWSQIPAIISFLDSPASISQQTYGIEWTNSDGGVAMNRPYNTPDAYSGNTISTITAIEVAA